MALEWKLVTADTATPAHWTNARRVPHGSATSEFFSTATWKKIARDLDPAYPEDGFAIGIGPIDGLRIPVTEIDYTTEQLEFSSPDAKLNFHYQEGTLTITTAD